MATSDRVLVITNDFPPRPGGIQTFVYELVSRLSPEQVVVFTSRWHGWEAFDDEQPFPVIRADTSVLLPSPRVRRRAAQLLRDHQCNAVLYGAAAPLGLLASALTSAGACRQVALTHGHEAGWAQLPGARRALRRIGRDVDVVTYLGEYTRSRIAGALSASDASRMVQLSPGVDAKVFAPNADARSRVRSEWDLGERPTVVCVSRLMPRKGQDTLIEAWPTVVSHLPEAALLIVGGGPYGKQLHQLVVDRGLQTSVTFTGALPWADLPAAFNAGDVFAMPARTRRRGLDVEGLGIVYLEGSASGLPVIAGNSGGAPDAVRPAETGYIVDGRDVDQVASQVIRLLTQPQLRRRLGESGRTWVKDVWSWERQVATLRDLLWPSVN